MKALLIVLLAALLAGCASTPDYFSGWEALGALVASSEARNNAIEVLRTNCT